MQHFSQIVPRVCTSVLFICNGISEVCEVRHYLNCSFLEMHWSDGVRWLPITMPLVFSMLTVNPHLEAASINISVALTKISREVVYTAASSAYCNSLILTRLRWDFAVLSPTSHLKCPLLQLQGIFLSSRPPWH